MPKSKFGDNRWDDLLTALLNQTPIQNVESAFQSEFHTMFALFNLRGIKQMLLNWLNELPQTRKLSESRSESVRIEGNAMLSSGKKVIAIDKYNQAIFYAPRESTTLALAHANRSVVLMSLGYFREAYDDCVVSLEMNYPEENKMKVLLRKATCCGSLKDKINLERTLTEIKLCLGAREANPENFKRIKDLTIMLEELELNNDANDENSSSLIKSKKMTQAYSTSQGRFMIANEDIEVDELILREKAYVFVPVYEYKCNDEIHAGCQNCAQTNIIPFPCYNCRWATYCSLDCKTRHEDIHSIECPGYKKDLWYSIGIAHLSIRTFLCGYLEFKSFRFTDVTDEKMCWDQLLKLEEKPDLQYGRVLQLLTNFNLMAKHDVLRYSLTAVMLAIYLQEFTTFFEDVSGMFPKLKRPNDTLAVCFGALILRHMGQMVCNGHAISGFRIKRPIDIYIMDTKNRLRAGCLSDFMKDTRIFTAIFPNVSVFNHSCEPNIRNKFSGDVLTIHALKRIPAGSEIYNCYGPHFMTMIKDDRQSVLKQQYCFECRCTRCLEEKPNESQKNIDADTFARFQCRVCSSIFNVNNSDSYWWHSPDTIPSIKCTNCSHSLNFDWLSQFYFMVEGDPNTRDICEYSKNLVKIIKHNLLIVKNDMRLDLTRMILAKVLFLQSEQQQPRPAPLHDLSVLAEELVAVQKLRFGLISPDYMECMFYVLDLCALGCYTQKVDFEDVMNSMHILSDSTREIVLQYIKTYNIQEAYKSN